MLRKHSLELCIKLPIQELLIVIELETVFLSDLVKFLVRDEYRVEETENLLNL